MARLTREQLILFNELHNSRTEDYKTFSKKSYRGVWSSIVDKYPESAHFVYELLQNADDAEASEVNITINREEMLFKHNGKKHFDITPEDASPVGDINSITGIGDSSKTDLQNKIGKFGVGFKAVFQYTTTPEIYDDIFKFKIENYIIPTLLEYDRPERKKGETLFVFPFIFGDMAFNDITNRLDNLQNPILFLRHLSKIEIRIDQRGNGKYEKIVYEKKLEESINYEDGITLQRFKLKEPQRETSIFLFTQPITVTSDGKKTSHYINVGFYYDRINKALITNNIHNIFCFFPTNDSFKTCFVCHAPFLLIENRKNLKPGEKFNKDLVRLLSKLATSAVVKLRDYGINNKSFLINENITEIIPVYKKGYWQELDDLFEEPMKEAFESIIEEEPLFLSRNGEYMLASQSCIGTPKELVDLLNKEQLNNLYNRGENKLDYEIDFLNWNLSQKINRSDNPYYAEKIKDYNSLLLAKHINSAFMSKQDMKWVTKFYTFLRTAAPKLWKPISTEKLTSFSSLPFRIAPIIKIQSGEWVAPYLTDMTRNVYLPLKKGSESMYNFVAEEYLKNEIAVRFFVELDIKEPDEYDYITSAILGKYRGDSIQGQQEDIVSDLEIIIKYYNKIRLTNDSGRFLHLIKDNLYLKCEGTDFWDVSNIYYPNPILKEYLFAGSRNFFDIDYYKPYIKNVDWDEVRNFLYELGVARYPKIKEIEKGFWLYKELSETIKEQFSISDWSDYSFKDKELENFRPILQGNRMTKELSLYIWNDLLPSIDYSKNAKMLISYRRKYRRYSEHTYCDSTFKDDLLHLPWIYSQSGELMSADQITLEDLAFEYNRDNGLIDFLSIETKEKSIIELGGTEKQQKQLDLGKKIQEAAEGELTEEEAIQAIEKAKEEKRARQKKSNPLTKEESPSNKVKSPQDEEDEDLESKLKEKWDKKAQKNNHRPRPERRDNEPERRDNNSSRPNIDSSQPFFDNNNVSSNNDNEEKADIKAEKKLKANNQEAQESAQKAKELVQILEMMRNTEKYSFKWYKLYMELMHANKANISDRHVQVDFSKWEFICSDKLLHLSNPSQPIPTWVAESDNIIISTLSSNPFKIKGLVAKSDEYSVDLSIEITNEMRKACDNAKKIRVVADNSSNFIDSFESRFLQLGFDDDYNLKDNLTKDIKFIYGPPGTGKTTKVVEMVHDILENSDVKTNILILTPTNKAADVIAQKMVDDDICYNYLTRFGSTESLYLIEEAAVVSNRDTTDMDLLDHNIVVTTAARFAYDCVQPDDTFICDYPWDYIIIDEASMMDLLTITYILYEGRPSEFIISGDPMQIQPVSQNDMPSYNVYDLVGLHSFADAVSNYQKYEVITLQTQHRSVPSIGDLVSKYAYNGIVKADPERAPQKPLILDGIDVRDINFLGFDVKEFDLISGLGAIGGSAFQLYSAIFTYNMAEYTIIQIGEHFPNKEYSIGIVCPYRAEADAIKQMLDNRPIDSQFCHVTCGTVHSFQGDECDIMFVVLNPPEQCTRGAHINNKNIINVAMSRARDYLFFVLPNGQQKGFTLKNDLGRLLPMTQLRVLDCSLIEEIMFGSANHIYSNTHVTCHKPVNVYYEDTAEYEVRMSDDALDIKIND